jgi:hypothetical protein
MATAVLPCSSKAPRQTHILPRNPSAMVSEFDSHDRCVPDSPDGVRCVPGGR